MEVGEEDASRLPATASFVHYCSPLTYQTSYRFWGCQRVAWLGKVAGMKSFAWAMTMAAAMVLFATAGYSQTVPPADVMITGEGPDDDFGWKVAPAGT